MHVTCNFEQQGLDGWLGDPVVRRGVKCWEGLRNEHGCVNGCDVASGHHITSQMT